MMGTGAYPRISEEKHLGRYLQEIRTKTEIKYQTLDCKLHGFWLSLVGSSGKFTPEIYKYSKYIFLRFLIQHFQAADE